MKYIISYIDGAIIIFICVTVNLIHLILFPLAMVFPTISKFLLVINTFGMNLCKGWKDKYPKIK